MRPASISGCRSALSGRKAERGTRTTASWFGNQTRHTVCPHKVCSSMTLQALLRTVLYCQTSCIGIIPELKNRCDRPRTPTRLSRRRTPSNEDGFPYRYLDAARYQSHAFFAGHFRLALSEERV